jgi:TetR/AcrR family transcriptional regulator, transcriptional repressor for nem operon
MGRMRETARARLLDAAEKTTHRRGFASSSIADIAKEARIPPGNVYYHFKTKDEIGGAIVESRLSRFRKLLAEWNHLDSPKDRLCAYVQIKIKNRENLARDGCPVGTLCSELQKYGGPAATQSRLLFAEALTWMETQFRELGRAEDAKTLALHLLSATQGVSLLGHVFHDPSLITTEAERLKTWIHLL